MKNKPGYIVFDLEATCWERKAQAESYKQDNEMETIEVGAVKTDLNFNILSSFQAFIKPVLNPILSDFCKNLTNISSDDINKSLYFKDVYKNFYRWVGNTKILIGWGDYDKLQLSLDCQRAGIKDPFHKNLIYINGKELYKQYTGRYGRGLGLEIAKYNLTFKGKPHRAINDATMTAVLFKHVSKTFFPTKEKK